MDRRAVITLYIYQNKFRFGFLCQWLFSVMGLEDLLRMLVGDGGGGQTEGVTCLNRSILMGRHRQVEVINALWSMTTTSKLYLLVP